MIRWLVRLLGLAAAGLGLAVAVDRWLGGRRSVDPTAGRDPVRSSIEIGAPIEQVWVRLADVERQPDWMVDLKWVRLETPGPIGLGSRAAGLVRILGIGVKDPVEVIEFRAPQRYAIRHEGAFEGTGVFDLEALDGGRTRLTWDETLVAPVLPNLVGLILAPILGRVFQADLERLKEQLEVETITVGG